MSDKINSEKNRDRIGDGTPFWSPAGANPGPEAACFSMGPGMTEFQSDTAPPLPYRRILDLIPDAIIIRDFSNRILDLNKGAQDLMALENSSYALGRNFSTFFQEIGPPERRSADIHHCSSGENTVYLKAGASPQNDRLFTLHSAALPGHSTGQGYLITLVREVLPGTDPQNASPTQSFHFLQFERMFGYFQDACISRGTDDETLESAYHDFKSRLRLAWNCLKKYGILESLGSDNMTDMEIMPLIREMIHDLHENPGRRSCQIRISPESEKCPRLRANRQALRILFDELLRNALQAGGSHTQVTLSCSPVHAETIKGLDAMGRRGPYLHICIADRGQGMTETTLQNSFRPFFTTAADQGHAGLGLSICREIVRRHQGAIELESTHGRGTTAHVYFPTRGSIVRSDILPETPGYAGAMHILMPNYKLCKHLHLELAGRNIRANYSTYMHEFIHLMGQDAIHPSILLISPSVINRAAAKQVEFLSALNRKIPFILAAGRYEHIAEAIRDDMKNIIRLCFPFTIHELLDVLSRLPRTTGPGIRRRHSETLPENFNK